MRRRTAIFLFSLPLLLTLSCTHKELCIGHNHSARVRVETDWSEFTKEAPTGMSVHIYGTDGAEVKSALSNNTSFVDFELTPGTYSALVFNQSPSEFGSLKFEGLDALDRAAVLAENTKSMWFKADESGEPIICQPEWFGTNVQGGLVVDRKMIGASAQARQTRGNGFPEGNILARLVPQNIIYTITVTVRIHGIQNLKAARGSLSGLAAGYLPGQGHTATKTGTELLEEWSLTRDPGDPTEGYITAEITAFGLPYGHKALPQENVFSLSLLLVDNKTKLDYSFPSGDRFSGDGDKELHLELHEEIAEPLPDVKPEDGSEGGFDANVDDWGDEEIVDIPI